MSSLIQVIFFSLVGGVFSLIGGVLLLSSKSRAKTFAEYATPFAAGALLAAAFVDLLREAAHEGDIEKALVFTLVGILGFFLLERFLRWFHHHHDHDDKASDPTVSLIIVGDTLHNFIDGIAIAAGFLVSPETGIVVTLAVAAHEIPQEIGDFGLLLSKGMSRAKVIWANVLSALATTVAAIIFFQLGQSVEISLDIVLGLVAGFFIYIAVSDIIPTIHKNEDKKFAGWQSALLIIGAIVVSLVTIKLHGYIDQGHDHGHSYSEHEEEHANGHNHILYEYEDHETLPAVTIQLEEDKKSGWNLELETENYTFNPGEVNGANVPGEGHAHLYINNEKITRLYGAHYYIKNLEDGDEIRVTLNSNDHSEYAHDGMVIDSVLIFEHDDHGHTEHYDEGEHTAEENHHTE